MGAVAKAEQECRCCLEIIAKGQEMHWGNGGWLHPWCPSSGTYLATVEDSERHEMALRVLVGVRPRTVPPCEHKHSMMCPPGR